MNETGSERSHFLARANLLVAFFLRAGLLVAFLASACGSVLALLLLVVATHLNSQLFALAVLVASAVTAWRVALHRFRWRRPRSRVLLPSTALVIGLFALAVWNSPTGFAAPESPLTSVYRGSARFCRLSPAWLVDEADQIRLGGILLPCIDPYMSRDQGKHFAETFNAANAELGQSHDFVQIGSAMGEAYSDMFHRADSVGHAYVYRPTNRPGERLPVLVFLHGWLGNMKAYVWSWSRLAEQHGFVVICPTFRNGVWSGQSAEKTLRWLDTLIREDPTCNADRVIVVGLSNGGTGVTRWATVLPQTYCGLVMISPLMRNTVSPEFVSAVGPRPILVVHGGKDSRIPPTYVRDAVARMHEKGLQVQAICYPEEDHVLLLSSRDRLQSDIVSWMRPSR